MSKTGTTDYGVYFKHYMHNLKQNDIPEYIQMYVDQLQADRQMQQASGKQFIKY